MRDQAARVPTPILASITGCAFSQTSTMKHPAALLSELRDISKRLKDLSSDPARFELDPDAVVDLDLARSSVDKLTNRVERLLN